jgi:mRNA-degrading endonuclease RelE of RelBE toxin-antitoxin system
MIPILAGKGWRKGRYRIVASSARAKSEWDSFVRKYPKAMKAAFERLSESPLDVQGTRQFPLKGKRLKPFWEYELTGGDRLYYAVDLVKKVIVVAVLAHATRSRSMTDTVEDRRDVFDSLVARQREDEPAVERAASKRRSSKKR